MNPPLKLTLYFSVLLMSVFLLSCRGRNPVEVEKNWPIEISENDNELIEILESGFISHASSLLVEGSKEHTYTLYLNKKGKERMYEKTGYVHSDLGYYRVTVSNPYDFDDLLEKYDILIKFGSVEMR